MFNNMSKTWEYSTNFFAILYQIKKLDCVKADIHELSEVPIQEPTEVSYCYDDDSDEEDDDTEKTSKGMGTNLIVSQTEPFKMTDDVYGFVNINKDSEGNEKNPVKTEEFQITLYSETLNADELRVVLQQWVKEYESRLNSDNEKHLKYFLYTPSSDVNTKLQIPTLQGQKMSLEFSGKMIKPTTVRKFKGMGLPFSKKPSSKGDLVVKFDIIFPDSLSESDR